MTIWRHEVIMTIKIKNLNELLYWCTALINELHFNIQIN